MSSRLALGTAQFGAPYGIGNRTGQISHAEGAAILEHAARVGMDTLDTAIAYGESEQRLGSIGVAGWRVVTKLPGLPTACTDVVGWVQESVQSSLARLGVARLYGLLLHRPLELVGEHGAALYGALLSLKERGLTDKIGVSIYRPDELDTLCARFRLDLVQAPLNLLDRRLVTSGWLTRLRELDVEVHVRSVFLQGLLLMGSDERDPYFDTWRPIWERWHQWLRAHAVTPLAAALGFVLSHPEVARVVIGVDSLAHLREIVAAYGGRWQGAPPDLATSDPELLEPSRWSRG